MKKERLAAVAALTMTLARLAVMGLLVAGLVWVVGEVFSQPMERMAKALEGSGQ